MEKIEKMVKGFRSQLPAERCAFCKQITDVLRECEHCKTTCYGTCSACHKLGAPRIHHPRRMMKIKTEGGEVRMCYPFCTRVYAYQCRNCSTWVDKSMLHAFSRQDGNVSTGICKTCAAEGMDICASCHGVITRSDNRRDTHGYKCSSCFGRPCHYISCSKSFKKPVILSKKCVRTFGMELEINNVQKQADLSRIIGAINAKGVGFSIKGDGSIHNGFEIVSIPAERRALSFAVKELCDIINKFEHDYYNSGLHVHIKDEKTKPVDIFKTWLAMEQFTFLTLPCSRRGGYSHCITDNLRNRTHIGWRTAAGQTNHFPNGIRLNDALAYIGNELERAREIQGGRYASMNLQAIEKYGTLEVRCHHATADYSTIYHWLKYLETICEFAAKNGGDNGALLKLGEIASEARSDEKQAEKLLSMIDVPKLTAAHLLKLRRHYLQHADRTPQQIEERERARRLNERSQFNELGSIRIPRGMREVSYESWVDSQQSRARTRRIDQHERERAEREEYRRRMEEERERRERSQAAAPRRENVPFGMDWGAVLSEEGMPINARQRLQYSVISGTHTPPQPQIHVTEAAPVAEGEDINISDLPF